MLVNGKPQKVIDAGNRGLAYGDGLFETLLLHRGRPVLLERHLQRLQNGCSRLGIPDCRRELQQDLQLLEPDFAGAGILKIIVTRGAGGRGYRPPEDVPPDRILSLHPAPVPAGNPLEAGIAVFVCGQRLARQPALAGLKHLNRLEQVLASREWPAQGGFQEGLMLDTEGCVVEGTRSNLFWAAGGRLVTPALNQCGVGGIMREVLLEHFGREAVVESHPLAALLEADEAFVCNSIFGVWPISRMEGQGVRRDFAIGEFARRAGELFKRLLSVRSHDQRTH